MAYIIAVINVRIGYFKKIQIRSPCVITNKFDFSLVSAKRITLKFYVYILYTCNCNILTNFPRILRNTSIRTHVVTNKGI